MSSMFSEAVQRQRWPGSVPGSGTGGAESPCAKHDSVWVLFQELEIVNKASDIKYNPRSPTMDVAYI